MEILVVLNRRMVILLIRIILLLTLVRNWKRLQDCMSSIVEVMIHLLGCGYNKMFIVERHQTHRVYKDIHMYRIVLSIILICMDFIRTRTRSVLLITG